MARHYSAASDQISLGSSSTLDPTSKTVSIWFIASQVNSTSFYNALCSRNSGTHAYDVYLNGNAANKVSWFWANASATGTIALSANIWTHVALVLDSGGGTAKGYVNGAQDISGSYTYTLVSATSYIGQDTLNGNLASSGINGSLADFALWNTALTAAEISALANGARPYTIRPLAIVAYLPLDGLQSPEPDLSGNKFNGTLTGTSLVFGPPLMQFTPRSPQMIVPVAAAAGGSGFIAARALAANLIYEGFARH